MAVATAAGKSLIDVSSGGSAGVEFGWGGVGQNVLLIIAHPDDESMFFTPVILSLLLLNHCKNKNEKRNIAVLCLSTGNADGLGPVRTEELYCACAALGIRREDVVVLDEPGLQDGFHHKWDEQLIESIVAETVRRFRSDTLLTFDGYGISGHPNHKAVHRGVVAFLVRQPSPKNRGEERCQKNEGVQKGVVEGINDGQSSSFGGDEIGSRFVNGECQEREIQGWELISTGLVRKYIGPLDIPLSLIESALKGVNFTFIKSPNVLTGMFAMSRHASQFVWYRRLFVMFSRYSYVNTLRLMSA